MIQFRPSLSYYLDSVEDLMPCPIARGQLSCDVLVVGGGFAGISAALQVAQSGLKVILCESQFVGAGGSGQNGGQAIMGMYGLWRDYQAEYGTDIANGVWDIAKDAMNFLHERRQKIDCDWQSGYVYMANKPAHLREMDDLISDAAAQNHIITPIAKKDIHEYLETDVYYGGAFDANSGHLHPLKLLLGLKKQLLAMGGIIYEQSPARIIDTENTKIHTDFAQIQAKNMIICGGATLNYNKILCDELYKKVMPVGSYIITTEPLGDANPFKKSVAVCDFNFILDYYRPTMDKRVLFGGRCSYTTLQPDNLESWMLPRLYKVLPQLKNVKIDYAWGGLIDITQNRQIHMGKIGKNTLFVQGFSGHGVVLSSYCGKILGDAIVHTTHNFDILSQFKHVAFPGGKIRTPLLALAMLAFRLRDIMP